MASLAGFDYRSIQPAGRLGRLVESIWYARGHVPYESERVSPTGSCVAILVLGDPIEQIPDDGGGTVIRSESGLLIGPHVRPVVNRPTGETHAVGVVTTPAGAGAALGIDPRTVAGEVVELAGPCPAATGLRRSVMDWLDSSGPDGCLSRLEEWLGHAATEPGADFDRCEEAIALLAADPTRPMKDVARSVGVSHGHLVREFTRLVGITPRALARLLRMRRLLDRIHPGAEHRWGALAAEFGWYDQAHMIRDFKRHTGVTPARYVDALADHAGGSPPSEGVGFVPDRD